MKIETRFDIGQRVKIKELGWCGVVTEVYINEFGVQFRVRYFANAKPEMLTFFEWEIEAAPATA